ncbi:MAG: LytTR family transcriptional regulator [Alphaproteobacteria bacterium]|nr:LytTR family transcriptional regulator [Alphaproteobacteria bacterium]
MNSPTGVHSQAATWGEILAWTALVIVLWSIGGYVNWLEFELRKIQISPVVVFVNEASSGIAALAMVLFVRAWLTRFPLSLGRLPRSLPFHFLGSLIFSLGHVGGMIGLRFLAYGAIGWTYRPAIPPGDYGFLKMLSYEYGKDLPAYAVFVLIIFLYRLYRERQLADVKGEGELAQTSKLGTKARRLRVRSGKSDLLLDVETISWLQAASNYVQVFADGREYLVRSSLSELEEKLDQTTFLRVHRSYMVNLQQVASIQPADSGGVRLEMSGGGIVPVGRKYKEILDQHIAL